MVLNKLNIIKISVFTILMLLFAVIIIFLKTNFETSIIKTVLPSSIFQNDDVIKIAEKSNSVVKVVFESSSQEDLVGLKNSFYNELDKDSLEIIDFDFSELLHYYLETPTNFLSPETRILMKNKKYNSIADKAIYSLYNPIEIQLVDYYNDPFFLLSDYLKYLGWFNSVHQSIKSKDKHKENDFFKLDKKNIDSNINIIKGDKYYDCQLLRIKNSLSLSVKQEDKHVSNLIKIQNKLSKNNQKIYLAGTPIHSYYTSRSTAIMINIICVLSTLIIIGLTFLYFRNIFVILPVCLSILFGFLAGFAVTKLWFNNFHIVTLLFSTTLIGTGIDYSYHYLFNKEHDKEFVKHLSFSTLTTILAFSVLYFTNIELLQQISVFTIFGLSAIYLFVLVMYPCFNMPNPVMNIDFKLHKYIKYTILGLIAFLTFIGLFRFGLNDSVTAFYSPNKMLKNSEIIYNNVSNMPIIAPKILKIKGKNIEDILQKEEEITQELDYNKINYIALSKFLPSEKRQQDNYQLVKNLYKEKLFLFDGVLDNSQISRLRTAPFKYSKFDISKYGIFKELILSENENIMFVYTEKLPLINGIKLETIDINSIVSKYLKLYRNILLILFPLVFVIMLGVLSLFYKSKKALKILSAPAAAIISSIGIASLFGIKMNMFTILALFLILGFTIDYSIFRSGGDKNSEDAILISCITTSFSFLALSFTNFKLVSSLSFILFIGIIISYIVGRLLWVEDSEQI